MNPSRRKGSDFARDVCAVIAEQIPGVERRVDGGCRDRGDVAGLDAEGWVVECKATPNAIDLPGALREAEKEAANAGVPRFVAVIKRKMKPVRDAYAVLPLWLWLDVVVEIRRLRAELREAHAEIRRLAA